MGDTPSSISLAQRKEKRGVYVPVEGEMEKSEVNEIMLASLSLMLGGWEILGRFGLAGLHPSAPLPPPPPPPPPPPLAGGPINGSMA